MRRRSSSLIRWLASCGIALCMVNFVRAAPPTITKISPAGLQIGGITTLVVEGSDLLPEPKVVGNIPLQSQTVKPGAKPNRVEIEMAVDKQAAAGIYFWRLSTADGISNALPVGVDPLPQLPFAAEIASLPVALHGELSGNQVLRTTFSGKKWDEVVVEIEARRYGAALNPVLHLLDARRTQIAWSQEMHSIGDDARIVAHLPADGKYTVELHDALYQAGNASRFRLRIGAFYFADHVLPLSVEQGKNAIFELVGTNWNQADAPAPLQKADRLLHVQPLAHHRELIGFRPGFLASDFPEFLADPEKNDDSPHAIPVGISGRIAKPKQEAVHKIAVQPGNKLRIEVFAQRLGSPLDGVLTVRDEVGKQLATADDQPHTADPGLDFTVPVGTKTLALAVKDVAGRGGADYIYRLAITELDRPDFSLSLDTDRWQIPQGGQALLRVEAIRKNYAGPIKLAFNHLPAPIKPSTDEIPAGASVALVSLTGETPPQPVGIFQLEGTSVEPPLTRPALPPDNVTFQQQPWLRRELAIAAVNPAPLFVDWEAPSDDAKLTPGASLPSAVKITRGRNGTGPVRLSLVTSKIVPKKSVPPPPKDAKPPEAGAKAHPLEDDLARAIRVEKPIAIPPDQNNCAATVLVPGDLPQIPYDLAFRAELLSGDGKSVVAVVYSSVRRFTTNPPPHVASNEKPPSEKPLEIFEDAKQFVEQLTEGDGEASLVTDDKYSGQAALKVTPSQRFNHALPGMAIKIREKPGPDEYRYLRFAWKKKGGEQICLQLNHGGQWGPQGDAPGKFRYHAGQGECFGGSLAIAEKPPGEWTVITRDLFADFGEFTLNGLAFSPLDGEYALFDHVYLGRSTDDLDTVKP